MQLIVLRMIEGLLPINAAKGGFTMHQHSIRSLVPSNGCMSIGCLLVASYVGLFSISKQTWGSLLPKRVMLTTHKLFIQPIKKKLDK